VKRTKQIGEGDDAVRVLGYARANPPGLVKAITATPSLLRRVAAQAARRAMIGPPVRFRRQCPRRVKGAVIVRPGRTTGGLTKRFVGAGAPLPPGLGVGRSAHDQGVALALTTSRVLGSAPARSRSRAAEFVGVGTSARQSRNGRRDALLFTLFLSDDEIDRCRACDNIDDGSEIPGQRCSRRVGDPLVDTHDDSLDDAL